MLEYIKKNWVSILSLLLIFVAGVIVGVGLFKYTEMSGNLIRVVGRHKEINKGSQQVDHRKFFDDITDGVNTAKPISVVNDNDNQNPENIPVMMFKDKVHFQNRRLLIDKGEIAWNKPINIGDIGLTQKDVYKGCAFFDDDAIRDKCLTTKNWSTAIKYIKVGKINSGEYKDYDLIIISGNIGGNFMGFTMQNIYILKKDKNIVFLTNGYNKENKENINQYFLEGDFNFVVDDGVVIKELEFPKTIGVGRGVLEKNEYEKAFFVSKKLKPVFKSPIYGQVWMTDHQKVNGKPTKYELNSYMDYDSKNKKFVKKYEDIFEREAFFIKSPDGMAISYKLVFDIFDNDSVLKATWNDGTINDDMYQFRPGGCGGGDFYVYNVTGDIDINTQLVQVGHTITGDAIYGYKDDTSKLFKNFYNNKYIPEPGKKKEGLKYVLDNHLEVFWVDPFGRLLTFYKIKPMDTMAECGKPVIYLYPKKPMDVNVQVKPNQGISVSEPRYSQIGWNVFAKPNGQLIVNGEKYPYLFWEGSSDVFYQQSNRGWVVAKDELDKFFDDKLKQLGLIQKEINDFKEFWIPEMTKNQKPYYFITFLPQRKINQLAPLTITPKPDAVIRVMMDYQELDQKEEVAGFKIKTPQRKGFTAVEWGGMLK